MEEQKSKTTELSVPDACAQAFRVELPRLQNLSDVQGSTPARTIISQAMLMVRKDPKLQNCQPITIVNSVKEAVRCGLEIGGPLGLAFLIPYKNECSLQISAQGEMELVRRSGQLAASATPRAAIVYENDNFDMSVEPPKHTFDKIKKNRGAMVGVWAKIQMKDGAWIWEYMSKEEVDKCRARAKTQNVWESDYEEMAKKTVIKRMTKWMPKSVTPRAEEAEEVKAEYTDVDYEVL